MYFSLKIKKEKYDDDNSLLIMWITFLGMNPGKLIRTPFFFIHNYEQGTIIISIDNP